MCTAPLTGFILYREVNNAAHVLAKWAQLSSCEGAVSLDSVPPSLVKALSEDGCV